MNPFWITEQADRASVTLPSASAASMPSVRHGVTQRPEPPDARLVQQIEALSARVMVLEKRLRSLGQCAVQQYWDGRLHLPAGKLDVIVGGTRMTMESARFSVVVNGKQIVGSTAPAGQSLQQSSGGSATSWQSTAAGSGIGDPRSGA
jgi:hypothetical protein